MISSIILLKNMIFVSPKASYMASTTAATERSVVARACNVEDIFADFEARRLGLLKAFTDDVAEFYKQCHPDGLSLRLYGLPNRSWELKVPKKDHCEFLDIPAPIVGINFARPMRNNKWIPTVAFFSDSWLLAVAFYYATKSGFDQDDRQRLHDMINDVPTLHEIVTWEAPVNYEASSEVTTEDEEGGSEDESDQEESDEPQTTEDEEDGSEDESDQEESDE